MLDQFLEFKIWCDITIKGRLKLKELFLFADIVFFTSVLLGKQNTTYMCVKAVVSQQSNKVDDLVDVLVVVRFVRDEDPPCIQERGINTGGRVPESIINNVQTC